MNLINQLIVGDSVKELKKLPDNCVDITITSPPYNLKHLVRYDKKRDHYYHQLPYTQHVDNMEDYGGFLKTIVGELIRVSKYNVFFNIQMLLGNKLNVIELLETYKHNLKDVIVWHKANAQPAINRTQLSSQFEFIFVFSKKENCTSKPFKRAFFDNRKKGQKNPNVIYGKNSGGSGVDGANFAIFPGYLVKWIMDRFTKEGDLILDPFFGLGTVGVVAKKYKRNYLGIDIDEGYIKYALDRINKVDVYKEWW